MSVSAIIVVTSILKCGSKLFQKFYVMESSKLFQNKTFHINFIAAFALQMN